MGEPRSSRPHFPEGYVANPKGFVAWSQVEEKLRQARNYWLCSVRPDGRPHVIPKWGVWVDGSLFFDGSPETRHAKNIVRDPYVNIHLESGDDVIIVEGTARLLPKPASGMGEKISLAYKAKYAAVGYAPEPNQWDHGGLMEVVPAKVLAWTSFTEDPTKFTF